MVTSTKEERKSIIDSQSKYQYTEREVVLTGLPRYDALNGEISTKDYSCNANLEKFFSWKLDKRNDSKP